MQMLRLTASTHLPLPASEIAFDASLTDDVNGEGRLAIVAAVRSEELRNLNADLKASGWRAINILPSAFGSLLVAERAGLADCTVVQKSDEGWTLDVIHRSELRYSRAIPETVPAEGLEEEVVRTYAAAGLPCAQILTAGGLRLDFASVKTDTTSLELLATPRAEAIGIDLVLFEDALAAQAKRQANRTRAAALMVVAAVLASAYVINLRSTAQSVIDSQKSIWARADRKTDSLLAEQKDRLASATAIGTDLLGAFHPAQRTSDILTIIGNTAPTGVWLTGVDVERGKPLMIRGTATNSESVASFVRALTSSDRFREVRLVFANNGTIEQRPVVQFSIQGTATGNLPLAEPAQVGKRK